MPQPPCARILRKAHVEPAQEVPPRRRWLDAHLAQVVLAPLARRILLHQPQQLVDQHARRIRIIQRPAPLARPEPRRQRFVRRAIEGDVLRQGGAGRADRPAENPRRLHADIDHPVHLRIAPEDVGVERLVVGKAVQHVWSRLSCNLNLAPGHRSRGRKNDTAISRLRCEMQARAACSDEDRLAATRRIATVESC